MKILTYTSYKKHCDLCTGLTQIDIILLSQVFIIIYKAGKRTGVENDKFIHINIPAGTYSIDRFNIKLRC